MMMMTKILTIITRLPDCAHNDTVDYDSYANADAHADIDMDDSGVHAAVAVTDVDATDAEADDALILMMT